MRGSQLNNSAKEERSATIKECLIDPRVISKIHDKDGRKQMASLMRALRAKPKEVARIRQDLGRIESNISKLTSLAKDIKERSNKREASLTFRIKSFFNLQDQDAILLRDMAVSCTEQLEACQRKAKEISTNLEVIMKMPDKPKAVLEAYYDKIKKRSLTTEEKKRFLQPDVLSDLSMEEYIVLWRRLTPHYLSHVTRQGFRDHNATMYHSRGLQEFHGGLFGILKDNKRLLPPAAVRDGLRDLSEDSIRRFLAGICYDQEDVEGCKAEFLSSLETSLVGAPSYPDKTAIHFAAEAVADRIYGGESSNEIFFIYPTDFLASRYVYGFNGAEKTFKEPQSELRWNSVFIWSLSSDNPGIPVDAGVVFLPKNTLVDPTTGSKYFSQRLNIDGIEKRVMVEDQVLVRAFLDWAEALNGESPAIVALEEWNTAMSQNNPSWEEVERAEQKCLTSFRDEFVRLGFSGEAAGNIAAGLFDDYSGIAEYKSTGNIGYGDSKGEAALHHLKKTSGNWKRAQNPIPAMEYWEHYFRQHPEQRPKHVVFYEGDPTQAVNFFLGEVFGAAQNAIEDDPLLGFGDNYVEDMKSDPRAWFGYQEIREAGCKLIEQRFQTIGTRGEGNV